MADHDRITAKELRFERILDAPVETVWRYLVDGDQRARWFMGGEIDPRPDGWIEFVFDHDALSDRPVPMPERFAANVGRRWRETVVRFDPPRILAFTFGGRPDSIATFTLDTLEDGRTRLVLHHRGIDGAGEAANFGGGWLSHLAVLDARIAGRPVADFWALHAAAEAKAKAAVG